MKPSISPSSRSTSSTSWCSRRSDYVDLILSDVFTHKTYYMGMVDESNRVNFYDGPVRVVKPDGSEYAKFPSEPVPGLHSRTRRTVELCEVFAT